LDEGGDEAIGHVFGSFLGDLVLFDEHDGVGASVATCLAGNVGDMSATCRRRVEMSPIFAQNACRLELYPDSVFWYGISWYFLGIFLTDTEGKLGKDLWYCTFGGNPFFACFCPLFDGPSPPFEESSRKISQNGAPAKSYSTKNTVHTMPNTNQQVPVTYQYQPNCQ
jgi:hypothetical protein